MLQSVGSSLMASMTSRSSTTAAHAAVIQSQFSFNPYVRLTPNKMSLMLAKYGGKMPECVVAGAAAADNSKDVNTNNEDRNVSENDINVSDVAINQQERRKSLKDNLTAIIGAGGELRHLHPLQP